MKPKIHARKLLLALLICSSAIVSCKKDAAPEPIKDKIRPEQGRMNINSGSIEHLGMDLWYSQNGPPYILVSCVYSGGASQLETTISYNGHTDQGIMWPSGSNTSAYFQLSQYYVPTGRYTVSVKVDDNMGNVATTSISVNPPPTGSYTPMKGTLSEMRGTQMLEQWSNITRHYFRFNWVYNPINYLYNNETVYVGMKFYDSQGNYKGAVTGNMQTNMQSFMDVDIPTAIVAQATQMKMLAGSSYEQVDPFNYNERFENLQYLMSISFSSYDINKVSTVFRDKWIPVN